jgi:SAM-dependent methyltransferase
MSTNLEQIEFWNGTAGDRWVRNQEKMDRALAAFGLAALDRLAPAPGESIIDVGCGGGTTLLQIAERVGASGRVLGVDVSRPLVTRARERVSHLPNVSVLEADAATHAFAEPSAGIFSRFGVMFFAEPEPAFRQLRKALAPEGRIAFVCWQAFDDIPWFYLPSAVTRALLPQAPPPVDPHAPGPFAFASPARVTGILRAAGFRRIELEAFRTSVTLATEGLEAAVDFSFQIGPVARLIAEQPDELRARIWQRMAEKFAPLVRDGRVELEGAAWLVTARA